MDWSVSPKDENWFLRVCHHISNAVYHINLQVNKTYTELEADALIVSIYDREVKRPNP